MDHLPTLFVKVFRRARLSFAFATALIGALLGAQPAGATSCSVTATPLPLNVTVAPADCSNIGAGTLLASLSAPFASASGKISGTIVSAVYQEGGGTLDFLYQVTNNSTCSLTPCDPITRETDSAFTGFTTGVATREDGGNTLTTTGLGASNPFVSSGIRPPSADRSALGDVVGWNFPVGDLISPGARSFVLVIATDATDFKSGNAFAIDGGVTQVASFEPAAPVPEPSSLMLLASGLVGAAGVLRRKRFG